MDQLAIVCIQHILSFFPLRLVFVYMRVNRCWQTAGRSEVRSRTSFRDPDSLTGLSGGCTVSDKRAMQSSLLKHMRRLRDYSSGYSYDELLQSQLLMDNRSSLRAISLHTGLPSCGPAAADPDDDGRSNQEEAIKKKITFTQLIQLHCSCLPISLTSDQLPCLRELDIVGCSHTDRQQELPPVHLPCLQVLSIYGWHSEQMTRFIRANAANVVILKIRRNRLPTVHHQGSIVYQRLQQLQCEDMRQEASSACPSLTILQVSSRDDSEILHLTPLAQQLSSLSVDMVGGSGISRRLSDVSQQIHAMRSLTSLTLAVYCCWMHRTDMSDTLSALMSSLRGFKQIIIRSCSPKDRLWDREVEAIIENNAELNQLEISDMHVTDTALVSMSRLTRLTDVTLDGHVERLTVDGILQLMRGPSRSHLCRVNIKCVGSKDLSLLLLTEVQQMQQERGSAVIFETTHSSFNGFTVMAS